MFWPNYRITLAMFFILTHFLSQSYIFRSFGSYPFLHVQIPTSQPGIGLHTALNPQYEDI